MQFESKDDFQTIYNQLHAYIQKLNQLGIKVDMNTQQDQTIIVDYKDNLTVFYDSFHPYLVSLLTNHVIATCEEKWLSEILKNMFYYEDEVEIKEIVGIARSILEGDREDIPALQPFFARTSYIYEAFAKGIDHETTFYYDPFLTFRLKHYGEMLIDCVELAIDEYLLEQEYQNLVENFRYFIRSRENRFDTIYLVHQEERFVFYNKNFEKITKETKQLYLEEQLLFEEEMDINEMVITPLVSFNPKEVVVYTNEDDVGVIYTIRTIFEERVKILPLDQFFSHFTNQMMSDAE